MAVTADSTQISFMFAGSSLPIESSESISISMCKLLFLNKILLGLSESPVKPINWDSSFNSVEDWSLVLISRLPLFILKPVTSAYFPEDNGTDSSKKFFENSISEI